MTTENEVIENEEIENTDEQDLIDAVGAAVDEATPDDILAANKETVETEEGAEQTAEEIAAAAEAVETEAAEKVAADEAAAAYDALSDEDKAAADKATEEYDALSDEEKTAADEAAEKAAEEAEAAAAEKLDPINDPIPESTKSETATRIKSLIELTKEATGRADEATEQANEIIGQINNTGADPDQYANTLGFLSMYNSKDPATRKQALTVAEGVVRELRIELGEGTVDLLDSHDDLKAKVEAGTLDQADAIEIATGREKVALDTARAADADATTERDEQTTANIAAGKTQLTKLETTLMAADTDYARLRPTFIAMLKPALRKTHATEWGEVAQDIYAAVKLANPKVEEVKPAPKITPLRPSGGSGGSADKEGGPDTALAAIDQALGSM